MLRTWQSQRSRAAASKIWRRGQSVAAWLPGKHAGGGLGRGLDFVELRAYQPGDDPRRIDWRHTARRGRPFTKLYRAERDRTLWLIVDLGATMRFATRGVFKSVQAARTAAMIAWELRASGDRVGGIADGGKGEGPEVIFPRRGDAGVLPLLRLLADGSRSTGGGQIAGAIETALRLVRHGDQVVVLSDFATLDDSIYRGLAAIASRGRLSLVHLYDPVEAVAPPPGSYDVMDHDGRYRTVDLSRPDVRLAWGAAFRDTTRRLLRLAGRLEVGYSALATNESPARLLARFLGGPSSSQAV